MLIEFVCVCRDSVIRRQLWLIEHDKLTPQEAYDTARREFYHQRFREDVERKVAKEEALHMGAYFGKSTITWGMELEDRKFYGFKQWAKNRLARIESQKQSMALGGVDTGAPPGMEEDVLGESTDDTATAAAADVNALSSQTRASAKAGSAAGSIPPIQIPEHRKVDFGLRL